MAFSNENHYINFWKYLKATKSYSANKSFWLSVLKNWYSFSFRAKQRFLIGWFLYRESNLFSWSCMLSRIYHCTFHLFIKRSEKRSEKRSFYKLYIESSDSSTTNTTSMYFITTHVLMLGMNTENLSRYMINGYSWEYRKEQKGDILVGSINICSLFVSLVMTLSLLVITLVYSSSLWRQMSCKRESQIPIAQINIYLKIITL